MTNKRDTAQVGLLGFLAGATVGVILGVLYAPREGAETRRLIKNRADEVSSEVNKRVRETEASMVESAEAMKSKVKQLLNEIQSNQEELDQKVEALEEQVEEISMEGKEPKKSTRRKTTK